MPAKKSPKSTTSTRSSPEIPLFPLDRAPGRMIYHANVAMRSGLLRILHSSGFDLSVEEWVILSSLWEYGDMTQPELGERVGKDRHLVSRLLDSLEARQLVRRNGISNDRRVNRVKLTSEGERARTVLLAELTQLFADAFRGISQRQYEAFMQCLDAIVAWHGGQQANEAGGALAAPALGGEDRGSAKRKKSVRPSGESARRA